MEKTIEIPFGAKDSELKGWEYTIPENMEAEIKDGKIIVKQKESEDEKIRKQLIGFFSGRYALCNINTKDAIAYLERQKERKPASGNSEKPNNHAEWSEDWREEDIQTRFAFYTYKDDASVLYLSNVFVEEASRNHGFGTRILRAAEKVAEAIGATTISLKVKQDSPANAWYRKNGYGYVTFEDGYDWLEKNLEYMKPYKQEWSEEDGNKLYQVMEVLLADKTIALRENPHCKALHRAYDELLDWLKSLRPKPHWKPSEEQMEALENVIKCEVSAGLHVRAEIIQSLLSDLKKL